MNLKKKTVSLLAAALLLLTSCAERTAETVPPSPAGAPESVLSAAPAAIDTVETAPEAEMRERETAKLTPMREGELPRIIRDETTGAKISANTLILSLDPEAGEEAVDAVLAAYGLEVLYRYESFGMMAVKLPAPLPSRSLDDLIARLEAEPGILAAMKDGVSDPDGGPAHTDGLD